jgi:hypothetical protein
MVMRNIRPPPPVNAVDGISARLIPCNRKIVAITKCNSCAAATSRAAILDLMNGSPAFAVSSFSVLTDRPLQHGHFSNAHQDFSEVDEGRFATMRARSSKGPGCLKLPMERTYD